MFQVQSISPKSCRYWYSNRNNVDMEPEYQRTGGIWAEEDQKFLIDSILNDYDIPKLYLADFSTLPSSLNEEKKQFAVIDGKQRLEALFDFFDNKLPLSKKFKLIGSEDLPLKGLLYKDLRNNFPEVASKVEEYPLPIMHVVTDELERINELFVRLNRGSNLTGAEKRNAMIGPIPKILRRIAKHPFFQENTRYNAKRGQNLNAAAKLYLLELKGSLTDTKKNQLDLMVTNYEDYTKAKLLQLELTTTAVLNRMTVVFGKRDNLLSSQGMLPVYYWLIKNTISSNLPRVRPAIENYLAHVKELKNTDQNNLTKSDANFIRAQRSTNDGWSYQLRYEILQEKM